MGFNDKLKELREGKGLTQQELADAIFVSRSAIAKWESGNGVPDKVNLQSLCSLFNVKTEELLSEDERLQFRRRTLGKRLSIGGIVFTLLCVAILLLPVKPRYPLEEPVIDACLYTHPAILELEIWGIAAMGFLVASLIFFSCTLSHTKIRVRVKISVLAIVAVIFAIALTFTMISISLSYYDWFFIPQYA